jgi:hypothetical protein
MRVFPAGVRFLNSIYIMQTGGGCSLCGAEGVNKKTCPMNPDAHRHDARHKQGVNIPIKVKPKPLGVKSDVPKITDVPTVIPAAQLPVKPTVNLASSAAKRPDNPKYNEHTANLKLVADDVRPGYFFQCMGQKNSSKMLKDNIYGLHANPVYTNLGNGAPDGYIFSKREIGRIDYDHDYIGQLLGYLCPHPAAYDGTYYRFEAQLNGKSWTQLWGFWCNRTDMELQRQCDAIVQNIKNSLGVPVRIKLSS